MTTPLPQPQSASQPSLAALTAKFLNQRACDPTPLLDSSPAGVELHEAASGFRADARKTWSEALTAIQLGAGVASIPPTPTAWERLSRLFPSRFAVALCVGNFPQMLGDLSHVLAKDDLDQLLGSCSCGGTLPDATSLRPTEKANKAEPHLAILLTVASHRLSGNYSMAESVLRDSETCFTKNWRHVWENERAAILWESGRKSEAISIWQKLPDGAVKTFNLGMAELFTGRPECAQGHLEKACSDFAETSGWSHIAQLYLALCQRACTQAE